MKFFDLVSVATLLIATSSIGASNYSLAASLMQPNALLSNVNKSSGAILSRVETRNRVLVIKTNGFYSVQHKDGKVLAEDISLEQLKNRFPSLYRVIETGILK